jgi:hypothetical protein
LQNKKAGQEPAVVLRVVRHPREARAKQLRLHPGFEGYFFLAFLAFFAFFAFFAFLAIASSQG